MDAILTFCAARPGEALAILMLIILLSILLYDELIRNRLPKRSAAEELEHDWAGDIYAGHVAQALRAAEVDPAVARVRASSCRCGFHD